MLKTRQALCKTYVCNISKDQKRARKGPESILSIKMKAMDELSDLEKIKFIIKGYLKDYLTDCYWYDFHHDEYTQIIEVKIRKEEDEVAKMMNCALVLHSMVDSFYNAMLKRGATKASQPDCLQVTDDTDLGELRLNI